MRMVEIARWTCFGAASEYRWSGGRIVSLCSLAIWARVYAFCRIFGRSVHGCYRARRVAHQDREDDSRSWDLAVRHASKRAADQGTMSILAMRRGEMAGGAEAEMARSGRCDGW